MTKLDRLIAELCPNGVPLIKFSDYCKYIRGVTYTKAQERKSNDLDSNKLLRANNITLSNNELNFEEVKHISNNVRIMESQKLKKNDIIICAASGSKEHIGKTAYISKDIDYTIGAFMAIIRCSNVIDSRFFFHILRSKIFSKYLETALNSSTINNLNIAVMNNFYFPLPPIEVQREIVRILDSFTELTAELTAELIARKKQYEFYRDNLFGNLKSIKFVEINKFAKCYAGATPKTTNKDFWLKGTIPWMTSGEVNDKQIYHTEKHITQLGYDKSSTKMIPINTVVIALAGQGKTRGKVAITRIPLCTNQSLCAILTDKTILSNYLYYFLQSKYQDLRAISSGDGTRGGLNLQIIYNYKIPLPPLEEQQKIVDILDRFDALCNDITVGLPAEIEARKKQYEYYREKLLIFKELKA